MPDRAITVRPIGDHEIEEAASVLRISFHTILPDIDLHTPAEDVAFLRDSVLPANHVLVASDPEAGTILGFIAFTSEWVNQLYVHPEAWRQGIGRRLLYEAKKQSSFLQLWTFQVNANARHFYRREGFIEVEFTDGQNNEEREPDVRLEWRQPD